MSWRASIGTSTRTNTPFLKEPELSKQGVFRSVLRFGKKDTNNAIALIWDQPKSKLYLDLNRNLDLTDDPAGVFSFHQQRIPATFYQCHRIPEDGRRASTRQSWICGCPQTRPGG